MKNIFLLIFCLLPLLSFAQREKKDTHWEVGLNSTQLLRNLFAQNPSGLIGNFTFFVKKGSNKNLFRVHIGGSLADKQETFVNQGNTLLTTNTTEVFVGLGFERRKFIYNKLEMVWGGDVLPSYVIDKSTTRFFSTTVSDLENKKETFGIGAGPIIGLRYSFSKYFSISTESSLYFYYSEGSNETREDGEIISSKTLHSYSLSHSLPHSLYLVMNF